MTPNNGKNTTGSNAVTARGIISVIHHMAIKAAIASVYVTSGFPGSRSKKTMIDKKETGSTIKPNRFLIFIPAFSFLIIINRRNRKCNLIKNKGVDYIFFLFFINDTISYHPSNLYVELYYICHPFSLTN